MEDAVNREVSLDVPPEEVWPALADPDRLGEWLGADVELELRPGARGRVCFDDGEVRHAIVQAVEPARLLSFCWWPAGTSGADTSVVTLTLTGTGAGTLLRVREARVGTLRAAA